MDSTMISLLLFVFVDLMIGGVLVLRLRRELADLRSKMQYLYDRLDEQDQELQPCIGFVFEKPDEDEYEMGMYRKGRR